MDIPRDPKKLAALIAAENKRKEAARIAVEAKRSEEQSEAAEARQKATKTISEQAVCVDCAQPFERTVLLFDGKPHLASVRCGICLELATAQAMDDAKPSEGVSERERRWLEICPPRYAERFDLEKLLASVKATPSFETKMREAATKIQNWPYGEKGVGIIGESGRGKTRLMFTLMRRYFEEGRKIQYLNLAVFGREIGAKFSESASEANRWIRGLCVIPALFFDDVGKERLTDRVETELYGIIEERSAYLRPIYFTANSTGAKLMEKMRGDDGELSDRAMPIVRRLREFCEGVQI